VTLACLCEKVPLSTSCPLSLILKPSLNNDPKAKLSAVPKSIPSPVYIDFFLCSYIFLIVGFSVKVSGTVDIFPPIKRSSSLSMPVFLIYPNFVKSTTL